MLAGKTISMKGNGVSDTKTLLWDQTEFLKYTSFIGLTDRQTFNCNKKVFRKDGNRIFKTVLLNSVQNIDDSHESALPKNCSNTVFHKRHCNHRKIRKWTHPNDLPLDRWKRC